MTEDGRIRDHVLVNGAWRDSITYSILEHEWTPVEGLRAPDGVVPDATKALSPVDPPGDVSHGR
jgi:hypothetical protein